MGVVDERELVVVTVGRQMMIDVGCSRRRRCHWCRTEQGDDEQQSDRRP